MTDKVYSIKQVQRARVALEVFKAAVERFGEESPGAIRARNRWQKIINEPGEWEALGPIPEGHRTNFETMRRAYGAGDLAIMTARRITGPLTGTQVTLLCCMSHAPGGEMEIVPVAELVDGNPYEMYRTEIEEAAPYVAYPAG